MSQPKDGFPDAVPDENQPLSSPDSPHASSAIFPRIAPPQGARAARGQQLDEAQNQPAEEDASTSLAQTQNSPELLEIEVQSRGVEATEPLLLPPVSPPSLSEDWDEPKGESEAEIAARFEAEENARLRDEEEAERFRVSALRQDTPRDREQGLLQHLTELRTRLLWCFLAVGLGMCVTFYFAKPLQTWFADPINEVLREFRAVDASTPNQLISTNPTGFFSVAFQFSLVASLILTMPFLFFQAWRFIEPALTNSERRYTLILVPFSSVLFFLGAGLGYFVSPLFFKFFLQFQPENVAATWDYHESLILMAKMLLVFGIMFQVPVVVIFGTKVGLLTRDLLIQYWRHAVVVIFVICAVLTPTWDPPTLLACAVPPCLLYALSIWIVKWL